MLAISVFWSPLHHEGEAVSGAQVSSKVHHVRVRPRFFASHFDLNSTPCFSDHLITDATTSRRHITKHAVNIGSFVSLYITVSSVIFSAYPCMVPEEQVRIEAGRRCCRPKISDHRSRGGGSKDSRATSATEA
jgi:hypothetical protein